MRFIWQNKKPRVSFAILRQGKNQGGLAVPDVKKYYYAVALSRVVEWAREKSEKQWVKIENYTSGTRLNRIIWNPPQYRGLGENTHEMTRNARACCS